MFLSENRKQREYGTESGSLETISLGGEESTVAVSGKQSSRAVYAPGGMVWVPKRGQGVLVVKAGMEDCIAGAEMDSRAGMEPGELRLYTEKASIWLKNDGSILLEGTIMVNGKELTV